MAPDGPALMTAFSRGLALLDAANLAREAHQRLARGMAERALAATVGMPYDGPDVDQLVALSVETNANLLRIAISP